MHLEAIKQLKLLTCDWTTQAREENITVDNVPVAEGEHSVSERVDWVFSMQENITIL